MAATARSPTRSSDDIVDSAPLLGDGNGTSSGLELRQSLREGARFLRRESSRRIMREPSMLVREAAAEQLETRQNGWAYSKPVVILDITWNFSLVAVAAVVMVVSRRETPTVPLSLWISGYAAQSLLHMVCVCVEFRRRSRRRLARSQMEEEGASIVKYLESANGMFSFIWWVIGFYWVSSVSQLLARSSPWLYWLCIIFLGLDVFFVVFCAALACVIGAAVCCCLPCIIAILYAVADQQEGASKEDVEQLPKFKFRRASNGEKITRDDEQGHIGGTMIECGTDSPTERVLSQEDAECCICLCAYDGGVELRELPCAHHFHCACVDKWLYINATCPLCKYNALQGRV